MRNKIFALGLLASTMLMPISHARLGETLEECVRRYGEVAEVVGSPDGSDGALVFEKGELRITCCFEDGSDRCATISYFRVDGNRLPQTDKYAILDELKNGGKWSFEIYQEETMGTHSITGDIAFLDRGALLIVSKESIRRRRGLDGL